MNILTIAFKSLRQRRLSSSLTALSVALGIMLMVAVLITNAIIGDAFSQRNVGVSMVIGPKGSDMANVLSAIYRIGKPGEPMPYRFLTNDILGPDQEWADWIDYAIPLTMGDVTEQGAFPIVGTTAEYFTVEYGPGRKFQIKGTLPLKPFDAVIGARVARENNWQLGSEFKLVHGGADSEHVHDEKFTVVGVLKQTGTANDRTVFVNLDGFYAISGHEKPAHEAIARLRSFGYEVTSAQEAAIAASLAEHDHGAHGEEDGHEDHAGHEHHDHFHSIPDDLKEISFVLVRTKKVPQSIMMISKINEGMRGQAVNPIFPMNALMRDFVGSFRKLLLALTAMIVVVAGVGIFVSIYNSMSDRRREIAIMRALGAHRGTVFGIILGESLLLCIGGGVVGLVLGHGLAIAVAPLIEAQTGMLINAWQFNTEELLLFPILLVMATLVGLLPAMTAYRTDVAESLTS